MSEGNEAEPLITKTMGNRQPFKIAAIISAFVLFIFVAVMNALAGSGSGGGVFSNNTGQISDYFSFPVTPAGWTFAIWGFIYTWQALWLIYGLTTLCRMKGGTYLYMMPVYSTIMYGSYCLSHICNVAWLFAFDGKKLAIGLPIIALQFTTLAIALFFACKRLYQQLGSLIKSGLNVEIWLIRMLIQNGIAFYAAWVAVATVLNLGLVLTYKTGDDVTDIGVQPDVSGTVFLALVAAALIAWFVSDIIFLDNYTRYVFSPYVTLTVASAGIVQKNYNIDTAYRNSVFSVILLSFAAVFLVAKIVVLVWRHLKQPIQPASTEYQPTI